MVLDATWSNSSEFHATCLSWLDSRATDMYPQGWALKPCLLWCFYIETVNVHFAFFSVTTVMLCDKENYVNVMFLFCCLPRRGVIHFLIPYFRLAMGNPEKCSIHKLQKTAAYINCTCWVFFFLLSSFVSVSACHEKWVHNQSNWWRKILNIYIFLKIFYTECGQN